MRSFLHEHTEDLRVISAIEAQAGGDGIQGLRERIDRMRSQNMRQVALAMWREKMKSLGSPSSP
jgi:hypothetical protein